MRLSLTMFFGKRPHGFKYRGKNRVVKPIYLSELYQLREDYERTEQNMLYLRHPYLTVEQSHGHTGRDKLTKFGMMLKKHIDFNYAKFSKNTTIAEKLSHLKVSGRWD